MRFVMQKSEVEVTVALEQVVCEDLASEGTSGRKCASGLCRLPELCSGRAIISRNFLMCATKGEFKQHLRPFFALIYSFTQHDSKKSFTPSASAVGVETCVSNLHRHSSPAAPPIVQTTSSSESTNSCEMVFR